jgi:multidrug efflux pump subunit AcrB
MMNFNLSAIAVRERAVTLFFILLLAAAGAYAFFMLGRAEDPSFTIKTLTVTTVWPGATAREMQDQVAEPLEKRISGTDLVRPGGDDHTARLCVHDGYAEGQHTAI